MTSITVAEYLAQRLAEMGIKHIFAVPSDYANGFLSTIDAGTLLQRVGNANELEAGYAADGYARLRGAGAVCVTYGVGSFSLLNATAGSYVEQLPVVVIVGSPSFAEQQQERSEGVLYHHSTGNLLANLNAFRDVTVAAEVLRDAEHAPALIDHVLTECLTWRRPGYLEVLSNLWNTPCAPPTTQLLPRPQSVNAGALNEAVNETLARLDVAQAPVILGGVAIQRFGLQDTLEKLIVQTGLPFATDLLGKSILAEDNPAFVGVYDEVAGKRKIRDLVEKSDCVLALGTLITADFLELVAENYGNMILAWNNRIRIGYHEYRDVPLANFLITLVERLEQANFRAPAQAVATVAPHSGISASPRTRGRDQPLTYESFFAYLRDFIDDSLILLVDESNSLYVAADDLPIYQRNGFIGQAAWGSIGYTVGAAVGVGFAAPTKRAVVVVGDGGFQMTCQALSTIVHYKQGAIVFVMNNGIYGAEQAAINSKFFTEGAPPAPFTLLPRWHYSRLAAVFGGWGCVVATEAELVDALQHARANHSTRSLIEVKLPERDLPPQFFQQ